MAKYEINMKKLNDRLVVQVLGTIDEDVDFLQHSASGNPLIEIDLGGLKGINSCGIREWIKWMETMQGSKIVLANCPKIIVDQINMVDGFLPHNSHVESFYVPYFNDVSGEEKNVLFKLGVEFKDGELTPPNSIKDSDGQDMEMDVIEAKYFKFLKNQSHT